MTFTDSVKGSENVISSLMLPFLTSSKFLSDFRSALRSKQNYAFPPLKSFCLMSFVALIKYVPVSLKSVKNERTNSLRAKLGFKFFQPT